MDQQAAQDAPMPRYDVPLILATLVQRVTFDLGPEQQIAPEPLITLRPKGGRQGSAGWDAAEARDRR